MKKIMGLAAASFLLLIGCGQSGTGGIGNSPDTQSGTARSDRYNNNQSTMVTTNGLSAPIEHSGQADTNSDTTKDKLGINGQNGSGALPQASSTNTTSTNIPETVPHP